MIRRKAIEVLVLGVALAMPLSAQDDDLARVRSHYDSATVAALEEIIAQGEANGVPRELLVEKAVEGVAKRASSEMVVQAVSSWADELRDAVVLLGRGAEPSGLAKAAESIRHGIAPDVVRNLSTDYPADFPIMLQAIEDLLHAGVELDEAQSLVTDAAERGLRGQDVMTLSATLRRLVREGTSPVDAAASLRLNLRSGRPPVIPPSAPPLGDLRSRTGGGVIPPPFPPNRGT